MAKTLVLYHYFETGEVYRNNIMYFLNRAYCKDIDFIVTVSGGCSVDLPEADNIKYVFTRNSQFDFGGHSFVVNNIIPEKITNYDHFIFINASVRGPFLPYYHRSSWIDPFIELLDEDVKLVGTAIGIPHQGQMWSDAFKSIYGFREPYSHVTSMFYAMDQEALRFLIEKNFFMRDIGPSKLAAIVHYELLLSQLIIQNGWNISSVLPEYQAMDYRMPHDDINASSIAGDLLFPGAYFGRTIHPYEMIFIKTGRQLIEQVALDKLSVSQANFAGAECSAYKSSPRDLILNDVVSAWKGHKNFAMWLTQKLKPDVIVDLGVDYGYSTFCFALSGYGHVFGVDSFEGDQYTGLRDTRPQVSDFLEKLSVSNVMLIKGYFDDVARAWERPVDILHIDGFPEYEAVKRDYENWERFVKPNGVVLLHDTCVPTFGVRKFFDEVKLPKTNFAHAHGLGVISKDVDLIREISEIFEALIEAGSTKLN